LFNFFSVQKYQSIVAMSGKNERNIGPQVNLTLAGLEHTHAVNKTSKLLENFEKILKKFGNFFFFKKINKT